MHECHRCETENAAEYACPDCDEYTCEDCFEPMSQFNAGFPPVCSTCKEEHEAEYHREADRERKREAEVEKAKAAKAEEARRVYNSPEEVAKRATETAEREARRVRVEKAQTTLIVQMFARFF